MQRFEAEITKVMASIDSIRTREVPPQVEYQNAQKEYKDVLIPCANAVADSLREHNMRAEDLFQAFKQEMGGVGFDVELSELQKAITDLEFEQALKILENLTESLGIQLEK